MHSTPVHPPAFGPTWPIFPELRQILKITAGPVGGVYQAALQQWDNSVSNFRSRNTVLALEGNGLPLTVGRTYRGRIVSAAADPSTGQMLPLHFVGLACCSKPSSSASALPSPGALSSPAL